MMNNVAKYEENILDKLIALWSVYVKSLPINFDINNAIDEAQIFYEKNRSIFSEYVAEQNFYGNFRTIEDYENGMNSPGILWDRITILVCKYLFTNPKSNHFQKEIHKEMGDVLIEMKAVLLALNEAKPAKFILLAKEATERQKILKPLSESLWNLQKANIAMWINQDLLYTINIQDKKIDPGRLQNYIKFFSIYNRIRNISIENIEIYYKTEIFKGLSK